MHHRLLLLPTFFAAAAAAAIPAAGDFEIPYPQSVFESLLPEDLPAMKVPEYFSPLDIARQQVRAGRYRTALYTLYPLPPSAAKSECEALALLSLGRTTEARARLEEAAVGKSPVGQRLLARADIQQQHWPAAIARLRALLMADPRDVQARALLGTTLERRGDPAAALAIYQWVGDPARGYLAQWQAGNYDALGAPADILAIACCLDREAYLTSRYSQDRALHDFILGMYTRVYDVIDRGNPEAHVLAARFFLGHDDPDQALQELQAALRVNPNHREALREVGSISLEHMDFDRAEEASRKLRRIAPSSSDADLLDIGSLLAQRQPAQALAASRGLLRRPAGELDMDTLGLHAAALALSWERESLDRFLTEVQQSFPNAAAVYHMVGEHYAAMRQYDDAETMLKKALALAPWMTEARNSLGLLYTQSGDEKAARAALEAARQLDPFNLRTTNYLRLLDELESFAKAESPHFIILHDAKSDPFIAQEILTYMEANYPRMTALYRYEPRQKTLIEIFPSHDRFSVRTTGSRWIATIGASTGRVIALVTPRKGDETMGPYEWGEVLRHEFTHTLTLGATGNRIPHWFTEGLAVGEEAAPIHPNIAPLLTKATQHNTLFTLDNITWGFARPRKPQDRSLAYAQSYLMCRYIREKYGDAAIGQLLAAIRDNVPEKDAIRARLGLDAAAFEGGFRDWMKLLSATWGYDARTTAAYQAACKRGEDLIAGKDYAQAVSAWQEAAKLRPLELLPHQRLAGLFLSKTINQPAAAAPHLEALDREELKSNRYSKRLAKLYQSLGELPQAIAAASRATRTDPWDPDARDLLAALLSASGDTKSGARQTAIAGAIRAAQTPSPGPEQ